MLDQAKRYNSITFLRLTLPRRHATMKCLTIPLLYFASPYSTLPLHHCNKQCLCSTVIYNTDTVQILTIPLRHITLSCPIALNYTIPPLDITKVHRAIPLLRVTIPQLHKTNHNASKPTQHFHSVPGHQLTLMPDHSTSLPRNCLPCFRRSRCRHHPESHRRTHRHRSFSTEASRCTVRSSATP